MDLPIYKIAELSDDKFRDLIFDGQSFTLTDITHMSKSIAYIEKSIEHHGSSCRIYTKGRIATVAAAAIPVSPTVIGG